MSDIPDILVATLLRPEGETGIQTHFNELGRLVTARGGRYRVVTPFSYIRLLVYPVFALRKFITPLSGALSVRWYRAFHYLFLRLALARELKREDRPIVYACCPLSAKAALKARRDPRQKVVMTVQFNRSQAYEWALSGHIARGGGTYRAIERLEAAVLPQVDGLLFISDFMLRDLKARIPAIEQVTSKVVPLFASVPEDGEGAKAPGSLGDLISIGTLEPRKNQAYLLQVLAEAKKRGFAYSLTLVGDGPDRAKLEALAGELGLKDQVRFLGYQPGGARHVAGHRAYVHSSLMESFGLVLVEAMARGVPPLAAPMGGIPEVFSDGVEGRYWSLEDPAEGAEKLIALLEDEAAYRQATAAAKRRFSEQFTTDAVVDRLLGFLSQVQSARVESKTAQ